MGVRRSKNVLVSFITIFMAILIIIYEPKQTSAFEVKSSGITYFGYTKDVMYEGTSYYYWVDSPYYEFRNGTWNPLKKGFFYDADNGDVIGLPELKYTGNVRGTFPDLNQLPNGFFSSAGISYYQGVPDAEVKAGFMYYGDVPATPGEDFLIDLIGTTGKYSTKGFNVNNTYYDVISGQYISGTQVLDMVTKWIDRGAPVSMFTIEAGFNLGGSDSNSYILGSGNDYRMPTTMRFAEAHTVGYMQTKYRLGNEIGVQIAAKPFNSIEEMANFYRPLQNVLGDNPVMWSSGNTYCNPLNPGSGVYHCSAIWSDMTYWLNKTSAVTFGEKYFSQNNYIYHSTSESVFTPAVSPHLKLIEVRNPYTSSNELNGTMVYEDLNTGQTVIVGSTGTVTSRMSRDEFCTHPNVNHLKYYNQCLGGNSMGGAYDGPTLADVTYTNIDAGQVTGALNTNVNQLKDGINSTNITNTGASTSTLFNQDTTSALTASFTDISPSGIVTTSDDAYKPNLMIGLKDYLFNLPFSLQTDNGVNTNESTMWTTYSTGAKITSNVFIYRITDPNNIPATYADFQSKPASEFLMPISTISSETDKSKLDNFKIDESGYYVLGANVTSALTGETVFEKKLIKVMFADSYTGMPIPNNLGILVTKSSLEDSFKSVIHNMNFYLGTSSSMKIHSSYNSSTGHIAVGSDKIGTTGGLRIYDKDFNEIVIPSNPLSTVRISSVTEYKDGFLVLRYDSVPHYVDTINKTVQPIIGLSNTTGRDMVLEGDNLYVATKSSLHAGKLVVGTDGKLKYNQVDSIDNEEIFNSDTVDLGELNLTLGKIVVTPASYESRNMAVMVSKN